MPDIREIQRGTHKVAIAAAIICLPVILIAGFLTELFQARAVGRLHVKYGPQKEAPWVDVAADRETLEAWRVIFLKNKYEAASDVARDYSKLFSGGKLTRVKPDTEVHITERTGEADCYVLILSGDSANKSGWVDCH